MNLKFEPNHDIIKVQQFKKIIFFVKSMFYFLTPIFVFFLIDQRRNTLKRDLYVGSEGLWSGQWFYNKHKQDFVVESHNDNLMETWAALGLQLNGLTPVNNSEYNCGPAEIRSFKNTPYSSFFLH